MNSPRTIVEYLDQLCAALRGADPALIQDALYDAEEHLRAELAEQPEHGPTPAREKNVWTSEKRAGKGACKGFQSALVDSRSVAITLPLLLGMRLSVAKSG